jgi:hypothetical protein
VLDLVPFAGSPRQVMNPDRDIEFIGEPLQFKFPQMIFEDVCRGERTLLHRQGRQWAGGFLEPCAARVRAAFRNRKYFRTNCPSRATSGPLQIQHAVLRSTVSGPTFALTSWYRALQAGQRKNGDLFGLGMSARNVFASLHAASIRAPG